VRLRGCRWRLAALLAAVVGVMGLAAGTASAQVVQATCSTFGSTLSSAADGETIVLTGLCTGSNASFALPTATGLTIEGASTGTNGFDGTGVTGSALHGNADGLTLRNLTFENYSLTNQSTVFLGLTTGTPTIDSDTFLHNTSTSTGGGFRGALLIGDGGCPSNGTTLTITHSTFSGNVTATTDTTTTDDVFGGGASIELFCLSPSTVNLVMAGNSFVGNSIHTAGASAFGAGLYADNGEAQQLTAQQSGNVFRDNSIVSTGSTSYYGAGEWLGNFNLTSTADEFLGNSLPGPAGASASSEGAGLGVIRGNCPTTPTSTSTATVNDLVAVDNTIAAPSSGGSVEGAGVYAGCQQTTGTGGFHLTLINSTVSGNSGPGGAAGLDGESTDVLMLENSIVFGDMGAGSGEIGGFGGGITASYSDLCSGTAPQPGAGNICSDPKLAGVSTGDVHETASSPTIDAGSNALVPSGITADSYGQARTVATNQATPVVDIGAAEWQLPFTPPATSPAPPSTVGTASVSAVKPLPRGLRLTVHCAGNASQSCHGGVTVTTTEILKRSHVLGVDASARHRKRTVVVARASYALTGGHSVTLKLKLNRKGRTLLKRFGKLPVNVLVTQTNQSGKTVTVTTRKLTIKPRKKRK
jgi:hypothetical protein